MAEKTYREIEESRYKLLLRIHRSADGPELVDYLKELSRINYLMFKKSGPENDQFCKGYAVAMDSLVDAFESASARLKKIEAELAEELLLSELDGTKDDTAPGDDVDSEANPHG